jgi:membrane fusion protein, macrolide-specific efflux system
MTTKRRRWPYVVVGAIALVAGTVAVTAVRSSGAAKHDKALTVEVKREDLNVEVVETGKVEPRERIEVKSKVAGQVVEVLVEAGDDVKKGQLLLKLDPTDFERDVARADAELQQARNALDYARLSLDRKRRGLTERAVSQADVDLAQSEVRAKAATVQMASVALAASRDRLRYTEIVAPLDGTVIERNIRPGEVVTPGVQATFEGRSLMTVADLTTLVVKANLNQIDVAKVKLGHKATVVLDALPGRSFEATVTKIAPAAVKETFPVEATLQAAARDIKPGMSADLRVLIESRPKVLSVPIEAVVKESGRSFVTKLAQAPGKKGAPQKSEVQVGARNERSLEVVSGVDEGEKLLINPASSADNEAKL